MLSWALWAWVCRIMAGLCLIIALAAVIAATILMIVEGLKDRAANVIKSKYSRRIGLLTLLALFVWILIIGQGVSAAEVLEAAEAATVGAATEEAAAEAATVGAATEEAASEEPTEPQDPDQPEEPSEPQNPDRPEEPTEPQDPDQPEEPDQPQDLSAPVVRIQMVQDAREDAEGNIFCRADNAGVLIAMEDNQEEDAGIVSYRIVISDSVGTMIQKEWHDSVDGQESNGDAMPEHQSGVDRIEALIETQEIAALTDGLITVHTEVEDAAGNKEENSLSFVLDTKEPELTQVLTYQCDDDVESIAEERPVYDETDLFYCDEQLVTRIRISDANPVSWKITYMEQSGPDSADNQNRIIRQITGDGYEGGLTIANEGIYSDWTITGEDAAGNKLKLGADCECTQDAEKMHESDEGICLPRRKILDRTAPIGEICYESSADGYLYEEENGNEVYWRADVNVTLRVRDSCAGQEMPVDSESFCLLTWEETEDEKSVQQVLTDSYHLTSDGQVRLSAYGKDRAGNPMTVREVIGTGVYVRSNADDDSTSGNMSDDTLPDDAPKSDVSNNDWKKKSAPYMLGTDMTGLGNQTDCRPLTVIVRDTISPTLATSINRPVGNPDAIDNGRGIVYYGKNAGHYSEGIPQIRLQFSVRDVNIDPGRLVPLAAYASVPEGENCEDITPEITEGTSTGEEQADIRSAEAWTAVILPDIDGNNTLSLEMIMFPGRESLPDGVYRFGIKGTDKAGNPLILTSGGDEGSPANDDTENELYSVICEDAENGTFFTGRKVVDTQAPTGEIRIENGDGTVYCYMREHANGWVTERDGFMPYRREKNAVIRYSAEDISPVSVSSRIRSTSGGSNDSSPSGSDYRHPCRQQTGIHGEQVFRLEDVCFRDRAGNESVVLARTVNVYLDTGLPNTDIDAPTTGVRIVNAGTYKTPDGLPLFAGQVTLQVSAEDPDKPHGASGLKEVRYDIEIKGKSVKSETVFSGGDMLSTDPDNEIQLVFTYNGKIEIPSGGQWENSDIVVRVTAVDNAGNRSDTRQGGIFRFGIDTTCPEVTVSYDNNEVRNGLYFDRERTARITVRERNFDASAIKVNAPGAHLGEWSFVSDNEGGNINDDVTDVTGAWVMEVRFPADGAYTLDVSGTDAAGNAALVNYYGEAPQAFIVDGTPPRIEVFWDNTDVRNGKYYNRERRATLRITDLSFDEDRVRVLPFSTGFHRVDEGNTVYEMELPFTEEGEWMLSCACSDLAGNTAVPVSEPLFVLDWTEPRLWFDRTTVQESGAYAGEVMPKLRWEEENPSPAACYAVWTNVTAGGKTMECRGDLSYESIGSAGSAALPDLPLIKEVDGACVLYGTACDLAGNRTFVRRNLSLNRFGSLYDLSEDEGTLTILESYYTEGGLPFVVTEYNISQLVDRQITLYHNGIGRVLVENTEYTVMETSDRTGWRYVYRIDPAAFSGEGRYSLLLESDDETGRHNSSPGRFRTKGASSPEWAIDRTPPTVRVTGVDTEQHRFVTDAVSLSLIPEDNMDLDNLTVRISGDDGMILEEKKFEKEELKLILDRNGGEVPIEIKASDKWQTLTATAVDGAGNNSDGLQLETDTKKIVDNYEEQGYRLMVSDNLLVHIYSSGLLPAVAFLAMITVVWIKLRRKFNGGIIP